MRRILALVVLFTLLGAFARAEEITVAAAADLTYAMKDLAAQFQKKTGNTVLLSFGASGTFYSQITGGAPYDMFFSADSEYPAKLATAGKVDKVSVCDYAVGALVLWLPNSSSLDLQQLKMDVLLDPSVKKVAIANPDHAPYGRAAIAALEHFQLKGLVKDKLVLGENISQAAQFVQSGNAQAGLIAESLALSPTMKSAGKSWIVPPDSYPAIVQSAGILTSSKHKPTAQAFIDFVTSSEGAKILSQYGFGAPPRQ
jgi:molybdate transport system substrate-binding protein